MTASNGGPEAPQSQPSWLLPGMAWQVVCSHMSCEDLLVGRLVCKSWQRDLGAFVTHATAIPMKLLLNTASSDKHGKAESNSNSSSSDTLDKPLRAAAESDHATALAVCREQEHTAFQILHAFPHCSTVHVAFSTSTQQQLAHTVINTITNGQSSLAGSSSGLSNSSCQSSSSSSDSHTLLSNMRPRPQLSLDAFLRSYHCPARQEHPDTSCRGPQLFRLLAQLPSKLSPPSLARLGSLQLDAFPDGPEQWAVLQGLPQLTELVLPAFRPALPYDHLPHLAGLTQLKSLTLSVQGSFTAWRASCGAFASLHRLTGLQQLSLHAFHAAGSHLASALACMKQLSALRLSGRIVLEPLAVLEGLTRLQVLELTQDVQYPILCDLVDHLPGLTQLAVGRVTLPPAPQSSADTTSLPAAAAGGDGPFPGNVWHPAPAAGAAAPGGGGAVLAAHAPPAAAEAAAVVVAADGGGGVAADGGVGEVMLEDVGAIVDGLIGNLQDGAVPVHLQRIIERFEAIIQLDLTRRAATCPWGWPVLGLGLLQELRASNIDTGGGRSSNNGCCGSVELALLRPADVVRLEELPEQIRMCQHLGLRLRDQLLAFASVCPVRLLAGQLGSIGTAFPRLASLTLCGKVAVDGSTFVELTRGLQPSAAAEGISVQAPGAQLLPPAVVPACSRPRPSGLVCLSLDCHFVSVSCGHMATALQQLAGLKVLSLRHRGAGKLPLPLSALPSSLHTLAVKKVLLFHSSSSSSSSSSDQMMLGRQQQQAQQQQLILPNDDDTVVSCHAITSPGFRSAVAAGTVSAAPSVADLAGLTGCNSSGVLEASNEDSRQSPCTSPTEASPETAGCLTACEEAAASAGCNRQALLPNLQSLFLKNCLVSPPTLYELFGSCCGPHAGCSGGSCGLFNELTRLSVTGDNAALGEVAEGWSTWLQLLKLLKAMQVLDLTVPENVGSSLPSELLDALLCLPRLSHLHLTTLHQPSQLLGLTRLTGLRTLSLNYTGPPVLPPQLLGQLQAGLGPSCKVQLWEMVSRQHENSFGETSTVGAVAIGVLEGNGVRGRQRRTGLRRLAGVAGWGAVLVGGWWCGWALGGSIEQRRVKKRASADR